MKRGYDSKRIFQVRCKSELMGWRTRLQNNYRNFEEFHYYNVLNGLATRLGYKMGFDAWEENPVIEGSVEPSDFRKVFEKIP